MGSLYFGGVPGVYKLIVWLVVLFALLVLIEKYIPRFLKGIFRMVVALGGIYVLALWLDF